MTVVAIVVTYNGAKWVDKCFGSLVNSTVPLHILAIDNASTDNTVNLIKRKFTGVEVIENDSNLGFGKANNIGLKKVLEQSADYVFLLNQDAWLSTPETLAGLIEKSKSNPQFGILSCLHLKNENQLEFYFSTIINPYDCPSLISDLSIKESLEEVYPIKFIHAAFWLISFDCLNTVGLFDPLFPHYAEDNDYIERVKYFGYKVGVCPRFKMIHDTGERKINDENQIYFGKLRTLVQLKDLSKSLPTQFRSILWQNLISTLNMLFGFNLKKISTNFQLFKFLFRSYSTIKKNRFECLNGGKFNTLKKVN